MSLRLVIFDMDGVILDSERLANMAWFAISDEMNLGLTDEDLREIKGGNYARTTEILAKRYGLDMAKEIIERKRDKQREIMKAEGGVKLKKGVVELLEFIKKVGLKCVVATSTRRESATRNLKFTGVYDYFDGFVFGDEVTRSKPDPEVFNKACEKMGVEKDEAVIIEDSVNGATAAHNGGIRCFVVEDTIHFTSEEDKLATKKFDSLLDVMEYLDKNLNTL